MPAGEGKGSIDIVPYLKDPDDPYHDLKRNRIHPRLEFPPQVYPPTWGERKKIKDAIIKAAATDDNQNLHQTLRSKDVVKNLPRSSPHPYLHIYCNHRSQQLHDSAPRKSCSFNIRLELDEGKCWFMRYWIGNCTHVHHPHSNNPCPGTNSLALALAQPTMTKRSSAIIAAATKETVKVLSTSALMNKRPATDENNDPTEPPSKHKKLLNGTKVAATGHTVFTCNEQAWNEKIELLRAHKQEFGHCRVHFHYERNGVKLGHWVHHQRKYYKHFVEGKDKGAFITQARIDQLNAMGFEWNRKSKKVADLPPSKATSSTKVSNEQAWEHKFELLKAFHREHGHFRVPTGFVLKTPNGTIKLGEWVSNQRRFKKNHLAGKTLNAAITQDRIDRLDSIGFEWSGRNTVARARADNTPADDKWEQKFELLRAFRAQHGHCRVPQRLVVDGVKLGNWVRDNRNFYKNLKKGQGPASITQERIDRLDGIGFEWSVKPEKSTSK